MGGMSNVCILPCFFEGFLFSELELETYSDNTPLLDYIVTGCIDPSALDRINPDDEGGQYDSSGGAEGTGNPVGSVCEG